MTISLVVKLAGNRSRAASAANCDARLAKKPSDAMKRASDWSRVMAVKAASISAGVLALKKWMSSPRVWAASFSVFDVVSADVASAGLTSTAKRVAFGRSSCMSPSLLASISLTKKLIPVALPPGCARLATMPSATGSSPTPNTIGIVAVAAFAAIEAGVLPGVAITAARRPIISASTAGNSMATRNSLT